MSDLIITKLLLAQHNLSQGNDNCGETMISGFLDRI